MSGRKSTTAVAIVAANLVLAPHARAEDAGDVVIDPAPVSAIARSNTPVAGPIDLVPSGRGQASASTAAFRSRVPAVRVKATAHRSQTREPVRAATVAPVPAARAEAIATQPPSGNGRAGEAASNLPVRRNEAPPPDLTALVKTYCASNAAAAAEARIAWQTKRLREIEQEVLEKSSELQRRTDELRALMKRRDDALAKVSDGMVAIYTKMRPDAAAQQFAVMNEETATTLLMRVDVRTASAILNEMAPERAARLAGALASMGKRQEKPGT